MLVDYHTHLLAHEDRAGTAADVREFLAQAEKMGIKEIGFTDHNRYYDQFDFSLIKEVGAEFSAVNVKTGIEMDYTPGEEDEIADFLDGFELDYVIGSIHYLDDWMFDHPDYKDEYQNWDIDELYQEYFAYVEEAAESGLFDLLGHLDLIKVFDFRPDGDVVKLATPALEVIAQNDLVIEINTNGRNKPADEFYPSRGILEKAYELGIKVTMSSDAHSAGRVGENLTEVRNMLLDIGYEQLATFENQQRKMVKL